MFQSMQNLEPAFPMPVSVPYFEIKFKEYSSLLYPEESVKPHEYTDLGKFLFFSDRQAPIEYICEEPTFSRVVREASLPDTTTRKELAVRVLASYKFLRMDDAKLAVILNNSATDRVLVNELSKALSYCLVHVYAGRISYRDKTIVLPETLSSCDDKSIVAEEATHLAVLSYKVRNDIFERNEHFANETIGLWARMRELEQMKAYKDFIDLIACLEDCRRDDVDPMHKAAYAILSAARLSNRNEVKLQEKIRLLARSKIDSSDTVHKILLGSKYSRLS